MVSKWRDILTLVRKTCLYDEVLHTLLLYIFVVTIAILEYSTLYMAYSVQ